MDCYFTRGRPKDLLVGPQQGGGGVAPGKSIGCEAQPSLQLLVFDTEVQGRSQHP